MSVTINNYGFLFGIVADKPTLPIGWQYIEAEGEWLLAENPAKQLYFVTRETLYPRKMRGNGSLYVQHEGSIQL